MNLRKLQVMLLALTAITSLGAKKDKDAVLDSINQRVARLVKCVCPNPAGQTYDYIIVGLGEAGSILARKLSDDFNNQVLVLEAGGNFTTDPNVTNANVSIHARDVLTWDPRYAFNTNVIDNLNFGPAAGSAAGICSGGGFEEFSCGRQWGGGGSHNFLLAIRGTPDIYNQWATISGDNRWLYSNLVPYMKAMETFILPQGNPASASLSNIDPAQRGLTGPITVTQDYLQTDTTRFGFFNAYAAQLGCANCNYVTTGTDYNLQAQILGLYNLQRWTSGETSTAARTRSSSVQAFLPPSVVSSNGVGVGGRQLTILSNATVNTVLFNGATATGVTYVQNGVNQQVFARKTVILCAGPMSSTILERSGIGDPAVLSAAGVATFIANTNVGANLRCHYGIYVAFPAPGVPVFPGGPVGFADGSVQAAATAVTGPNGPTGAFAPGIQGLTAGQRNFQILGIATAASAITQEVAWACDPTLTPGNYPKGFGGFVAWNLRPKSLGTIHIVNADPATLPFINFNLYSDTGASGSGTDIEVSAAMLNSANNVAAAFGMSLIYPSTAAINFPITNAQVANKSTSTQVAAIRSMLLSPTTTTNHYCGTCQMGTSIANGVVDGRLNVFGTTPESLKVADNSIAPLPETGNTSYQAYTIGMVASNILGVFNP